MKLNYKIILVLLCALLLVGGAMPCPHINCAVQEPNGRTIYDVWSSKTGYGNSTVAQKLAVGR